MLLNPITWVDRAVEFARRFTDQNANELTLTPSPGTITEEGTPFSATNMNSLVNALTGKYDVVQEITYDDDLIIKIDYLVATVLRRRETISYDNGLIDEINYKIYDTDGTTVLDEFTDTINYDDGKIDEIVRVVA